MGLYLIPILVRTSVCSMSPAVVNGFDITIGRIKSTTKQGVSESFAVAKNSNSHVEALGSIEGILTRVEVLELGCRYNGVTLFKNHIELLRGEDDGYDDEHDSEDYADACPHLRLVLVVLHLVSHLEHV